MMTRAGKRERDKEATGKTKTQTWSPNTYALARTTLEITIGCLCQGPSRRFQGACKLSTCKKKNLFDGWAFWSVFQDGSNETRKKRVHVSWPPLARTHAKHLRMNPLVHACSVASGSRADSVRTTMKSSGLRSGEHGGHVRSWISRSFKNALVHRLVCDGALSSCHHQLDVSVPRRAMQSGKYTSSSIRM